MCCGAGPLGQLRGELFKTFCQRRSIVSVQEYETDKEVHRPESPRALGPARCLTKLLSRECRSANRGTQCISKIGELTGEPIGQSGETEPVKNTGGWLHRSALLDALRLFGADAEPHAGRLPGRLPQEAQRALRPKTLEP